MRKIIKDIEIILGILLVIMLFKYFFMPDILNWIAGYDVYSSACSLKISNIDDMTIAGIPIPDLCNTARLVLLGVIAADVIFIVLVYVLDRYLEKGVKK